MNVPDWSGEFVEVEGEDLGLMPLHPADRRQAVPPKGWTFTGDIHVDDEAQVLVYRRSAL